MKNEMDCKTCRAALPDLLLDREFAGVRPELAAHMIKCAECRIEFTELKATFAMLDEWAAPEVSPYFDAKLHVRLREAVAAEPEGIWERMRSFLAFSTGRALRPVMAGTLGLALMLSGGTALLMNQRPASANDPASATVDDLKIMNNNAQAFQQMDQLLDEPAQSTDDSGGPPTT